MELIRKSFETTDGEIYTEIPYDTKTQNWVYGVTWEFIEIIMKVIKKYNYNLTNRDAAKIIINLTDEYKRVKWSEKEIIDEIEIYIATYDSLDNYHW